MLIRNLTAEHVYLACGRTDMRKSIDGLAALVLSKFQLDSHQSVLFLFCGRRKERIKGLLWDETELCSRTEKTKRIMGDVGETNILTKLRSRPKAVLHSQSSKFLLTSVIRNRKATWSRF